MAILVAEQLTKYYKQHNIVEKALNGVDLTIAQGDFIAVIGSSGSGKTTLLNILGGLDEPTAGKVWVHNQDISKLSRKERTIFRRRNIGFIFQNYNLVSHLSVLENILLPLRLDGRMIDQDFVKRLVSTLKIDTKLDSFPEELSGGQQQRVAIARALVAKPAIILADEPTGNLDSKTSQEVIHLLKQTAQQFSQTVIVVTHDIEIAQLADNIIRIEDGRIVEGCEAND
ncbi:ABC transporter ATP-binding protein [uncultured Enterococcus sp.]|uniref:ABC transporter ATP-binding protein n=1 Tax=uncultured Enterococcus sp. TaxID=167972 RepID=UPI002636C306|nr:ABC transporter ATP-binding protein [uncultured Enterococcus sp.]